MKGKIVFVLVLIMLFVSGPGYTASKSATKISKSDEATMTYTNFAARSMYLLNKICDDLDTLFTLTGGLSSDSVYQTVIKSVRNRARWGYIDTISADTIYGRVGKNVSNRARVSRSDTVYSDTVYSRTVKGINGRLRSTFIDTIKSGDTLYSRVVASGTSRPSYAIADSIKVSTGGNIKALTVQDAAADTLVITIGAKTWKFLPVADQ